MLVLTPICRFLLISALMSTFSVTAACQVATLDSDTYEPLKFGFWITMSIATVLSTHCLITCVFTIIYGSGLALRGPAG